MINIAHVIFIGDDPTLNFQLPESEVTVTTPKTIDRASQCRSFVNRSIVTVADDVLLDAGLFVSHKGTVLLGAGSIRISGLDKTDGGAVIPAHAFVYGDLLDRVHLPGVDVIVELSGGTATELTAKSVEVFGALSVTELINTRKLISHSDSVTHLAGAITCLVYEIDGSVDTNPGHDLMIDYMTISEPGSFVTPRKVFLKGSLIDMNATLEAPEIVLDGDNDDTLPIYDTVKVTIDKDGYYTTTLIVYGDLDLGGRSVGPVVLQGVGSTKLFENLRCEKLDRSEYYGTVDYNGFVLVETGNLPAIETTVIRALSGAGI